MIENGLILDVECICNGRLVTLFSNIAEMYVLL
jgi:hypothetical protein